MRILPWHFVRSDPPGGVFQPGRLPGRKRESRDFGVASGVHERKKKGCWEIIWVKRFVGEESGTCLKRSYLNKKMRVCWKNVHFFEVHDVFLI